MESKTCVVCGKEFIPRTTVQITCSDRCREERNREMCRARKATRREPKICVVCGKEFKPHGNNQMTCGTKCSHIRRAENFRAWKEEHRNLEPPPRTTDRCLTCGKTLSRDKRYGDYCSGKCKHAAEDGSEWRELYPGTANLMRLWSAEGWPVWQIAQVLGRHHSQVEEVLGDA